MALCNVSLSKSVLSLLFSFATKGNIYKILVLLYLPMKRTARFTKAVTARFPEEVFKAIEKVVQVKQEDFPRYTEGDVVRSAVIKHLKEKGYLDKGKNYL